MRAFLTNRVVMVAMAVGVALSATVIEARAPRVLLTTTVVTFDADGNGGTVKHVCSNCEPVAGATMFIEAVAGGSWDSSGTTDASGKVVFDIPSGISQVPYTVSKSGCEVFDATVYIASNSRRDSGVVDLRCPAPAP